MTSQTDPTNRLWAEFGLALPNPQEAKAFRTRYEHPVQATYAVMADITGQLSKVSKYGETRTSAVLDEMEVLAKDARLNGRTTGELARKHGIKDEDLGLLVIYGEMYKLHLKITKDMKD